MSTFRRLSDVLKRKKPPKRSLGRKCKNTDESQTETPTKGSPSGGSRSSNRSKSAGEILEIASFISNYLCNIHVFLVN